MREVFKGFLVLRLVGLLALLIVVGAVLGISALTRGSVVAGVAVLAVVALLTAAIGAFVARRARGPAVAQRSRSRAPSRLE